MSNRKFRVGLTIGVLAFSISPRPAAANTSENFEVRSGMRGCESVVNYDASENCKNLSATKDRACNQSGSCDPGRHEKEIREYNDKKQELSQAKDSDKSRLEGTVRDIKAKLDERVSEARQAEKIAQACIDARADVQRFFKDRAIPLTELKASVALKERERLLEKLKAADERRKVTKEKRDAKPDDSSLKSEYEKAADEYRDVEKELQAFNNRYGSDIQRHAERLVRHYQDERETHGKANSESQGRLDNCKKLLSMSY